MTSILQSEIYEQPEAIRLFIERESENVSRIVEQISQRDFDYVLIAARGTSDNAARYGQYLFGMFNRLPVALAAPSLFTVYDTPPKLERALVIGISQSGQSPDVVSVLEEAKRQGAPTITITNDQPPRWLQLPTTTSSWGWAKSTVSPPPKPTRLNSLRWLYYRSAWPGYLIT